MESLHNEAIGKIAQFFADPLPRRPCGHPPEREGPRPSAALARNMHEIGPAIGVEQEGSARHILDA